MNDAPENVAPILSQVRGRRLFQWMFAYVAGAWILVELTDFLVEQFGWPSAVVGVVLTAAAAGFFVALVLAWFHGETGRQEVTRPEVGLLAVVSVVGLLAVGWTGVNSDWDASAADGARSAVSRDRGDGATLTAGLTRSAWAGDDIADPREAPLALAVLPFLNLDVDAEGAEGGARSSDAFADGVTEDILYEVSLLPGLRVISRTSTAQYRGTTLSLVEVGRELDVDLILEGSARRVGDQARIRAQLIDARTDENLWSGSFDREISNMLVVQAEVAEEIARAVGRILGVGDAGTTGPTGAVATTGSAVRTAGRSVDPEVYRLALEGRQLLRSGDPADAERGVRLLGDAMRRDPGLELAQLALARHLESGSPAASPAGTTAGPAGPDRAVRGVDPAVRTMIHETLASAEGRPRPGRPLPHWQLPLDRGALDEGEAVLRRALAANPNDAGARRWFGVLLAQTGRLEEGLEHLRVARVLDPNSAGVEAALGSVLARMGRHAEALATYDAAVRRVPEGSPQRVSLEVERAVVRSAAGDLETALGDLRRIAASSPGRAQPLGALGYLLAGAGREADARAVLEELSALGPGASGVELARAEILSALGEDGRARAALDRAVSEAGWAALSPAAQRVTGGS